MNGRFILQHSTTPGWWVATDKENGIVVKFKNHKYNDTQNTTFLNGDTFHSMEEFNHALRAMRELADWLHDNHYNKVF